jgi:hypothetical protein
MRSVFLESNGHDESDCNSVASATNPPCLGVIGTKSGQGSCARSPKSPCRLHFFTPDFLTLILTMKSFVAGTLLQDRIAPARHGFFMPEEKLFVLEKKLMSKGVLTWLCRQRSSVAAKEW